jgi:small subunit ribosomal protein S15
MSLNKQTKEQLIKEFGAGAQDSGSAAVQIAVLTERIRQLTGHLQKNRKDFSSKRGLLVMVSKRRAFLNYLQRTDKEQYQSVIQRLELKK